MLHVFSVHVNPFWGPIQRRFLDSHVKDFRLYASLRDGQDIPTEPFDRWDRQPEEVQPDPAERDKDHRIRLVRLINKFLPELDAEDMICVLDSDSLVVGDRFAEVMNKARQYEVVGVKPIEAFHIRPKPSPSRVTRPWAVCMSFLKKTYVKYMQGSEEYHHYNVMKQRMCASWYPLLPSNDRYLYAPRIWSNIVYKDIVYHFGHGSTAPSTAEPRRKRMLDFIQKHDDFVFRLGILSRARMERQPEETEEELTARFRRLWPSE